MSFPSLLNYDYEGLQRCGRARTAEDGMRNADFFGLLDRGGERSRRLQSRQMAGGGVAV